MAAQGMVHEDLVSALAARLARLNQRIDDTQRQTIAEQADGRALGQLTARLLNSIDPDVNAQKAAEQFGLSEGQEPTDQQLRQVEQESMDAALKPLHNPKLRETILSIHSSLEQVIDETTQDELVVAEFDAKAKAKAQSVLADFRQFIEDHRDEIEAIQILYSRPYRAGLRYRHVKELAEAIKLPPMRLGDPVARLWPLYQAFEPDRVKGKGSKLADLVAIVRHAIDPSQDIVSRDITVEERYQQWLDEQKAAGVTFTPDQRQWLDAIKDHIANSLTIDRDDFDDVPFSQMGGLGKAYQLFGDRLAAILKDLNDRLAA